MPSRKRDRRVFRTKAVQEFRNLRVWERAHRLTLSVYRVTRSIRKSDYPGLVPQIRRSAASIPANIAEGCGHAGPREFARFLQMALASAFELDYHLLLASDLRLIPRVAFLQLQTELQAIKKMLVTLIDRVRTPLDRGADSGEQQGDNQPITNDQPPGTSLAAPSINQSSIAPGRCADSSPR